MMPARTIDVKLGHFDIRVTGPIKTDIQALTTRERPRYRGPEGFSVWYDDWLDSKRLLDPIRGKGPASLGTQNQTWRPQNGRIFRIEESVKSDRIRNVVWKCGETVGDGGIESSIVA